MLAALLVAVPSFAMNEPYQLALPDTAIAFPRDYFSHPASKPVVVFYTGNSAVGKTVGRFGSSLRSSAKAVFAMPPRLNVGCSRSLPRALGSQRYKAAAASITPSAPIALAWNRRRCTKRARI